MIYTMSSKRDTITLNTETGDITGGTYGMKEIIKSDLYATWDAGRRVWHSDKLAETIESYKDYLTRLYKLSAVETNPSNPIRERVVNVRNGICPRCHTYCYGDCRA